MDLYADLKDRQINQCTKLGQAIRQSYIDQRRRRFAGFKLDERLYGDEFWFRVGKKLFGSIRNPELFEPDAYMRIVFDLYSTSTKSANPDVITHAKCLNAWNTGDFVAAAKERALRQFQMMSKLYATHCSFRSKVDVLQDEELYFNSVFRYVMAKKNNMTFIMDRYLPYAKQFLRSNKEYISFVETEHPELVEEIKLGSL